MKNLRSVGVLLVAFLILMASCATSGFTSAKGPEADFAKEVEKINKSGGVAVIGTGVDETGREDLALKKATLDGRAQLAQMFEVNMAVLQKNFIEEVGSTASAEVNALFSDTTKAVSKTTLTGSRNLSTPIIKKEKSRITVKVIVGIDPKTLNSAVMTEMKNASPNLYERFRASQSFSELQKEMEAYEKSGN